MKVIDRISPTTAEWAADEFINYFGHFTSIEDYLRFVKKEVISQTSSLFPLHDEFFNEDILSYYKASVYIITFCLRWLLYRFTG